MIDIFSLSVEEMASNIKKGQLTSVEVCEQYIDRINKFEKDIKAWAHFDRKILLEKANDVINQVSYYLNLNEDAMNNGAKPFAPNQFLALTNSLLLAQKLGKISMGEVTENINVNQTIKEADAFKSVMELLDSVKEQRLTSDSDSLH